MMGERILEIQQVNEFDPTAIRQAMVAAANGIYVEDQPYSQKRSYFANIPVGRLLSQVDLNQLLAETYIDTPDVCQYGYINNLSVSSHWGETEVNHIDPNRLAMESEMSAFVHSTGKFMGNYPL